MLTNRSGLRSQDISILMSGCWSWCTSRTTLTVGICHPPFPRPCGQFSIYSPPNGHYTAHLQNMGIGQHDSYQSKLLTFRACHVMEWPHQFSSSITPPNWPIIQRNYTVHLWKRIFLPHDYTKASCWSDYVSHHGPNHVIHPYISHPNGPLIGTTPRISKM